MYLFVNPGPLTSPPSKRLKKPIRINSFTNQRINYVPSFRYIGKEATRALECRNNLVLYGISPKKINELYSKLIKVIFYLFIHKKKGSAKLSKGKE